MIRVNLLPIKQQRRRASAKKMLFVFLALIGLELLVFAAVYFTYDSELTSLKDRVAVGNQEVAAAKEEVKDAEQLQRDRDQLTQQLQILDDLERQRSGPVRMMDELQAMLSPPRNEEDRFAQLQKNWNVEWDPQRLWLDSVEETNAAFKLKGGAANPDDVAEFLQRLSTGRYFDAVELDVVTAKGGQGTSSKYVEFQFAGKLNYTGQKAVAPAPAPAQ
jgi:type IV pilus assembly protein PilN